MHLVKKKVKLCLKNDKRVHYAEHIIKKIKIKMNLEKNVIFIGHENLFCGLKNG